MIRTRLAVLVTLAALVAPWVAPCLAQSSDPHARMACCKPSAPESPAARPCCAPADPTPASPAGSATRADAAQPVMLAAALAPIGASPALAVRAPSLPHLAPRTLSTILLI